MIIHLVLQILQNILAVYTLYTAMHIFFESVRVKKVLEIGSFVVFIILANLILLKTDFLPLIMAFHLVGNFILTLQYRATMKKRILAVTLIYLLFASIEVLTGLALLRIPFYAQTKTSVFTLILLRFATFFGVCILDHILHYKKRAELPMQYWLQLLLIPVATLGILYVAMNIKSLTFYEEATITVLIIVINLGTYYLYDHVLSAIEEQRQKDALNQKNEFYVRQLETLTASMQEMDAFKMDLNNHLLCLHALEEHREHEQVIQHLNEMLTFCHVDKKYAESGHQALDAIINYKLQQIDTDKIFIHINLTIPREFRFPSFDAAILVGNLMDHVIGHLATVEKGKLSIMMRYEKGKLFINLETSCAPVKNDQVYEFELGVSAQTEARAYLKSVQELIYKYNGILKINQVNRLLSIAALLYVS